MSVQVRVPRLAFVGTGWIGRSRMEAAVGSGRAEAASIVDIDLAAAQSAAKLVSCGMTTDRLEEALDARPDGLVIATPNALHAEQAIAALDADIPVFCQKPLARTGVEARRVVEAARRNDLTLGVDMSYRYVEAFVRARAELAAMDRRPYTADLWFHNAYGPDKAWFTDPALSGGGCALDLGTHLIDLALWFLDEPAAHNLSARLFRRGIPVDEPGAEAEDYAAIELRFNDRLVRIACSWFLSAGVDALIGATFHTPDASVHVENVGGSYLDFRSERRDGRVRSKLAEPPDDWGGRALLDWVERVARGEGFDPEIEQAVRVADILDRVYGRAS